MEATSELQSQTRWVQNEQLGHCDFAAFFDPTIPWFAANILHLNALPNEAEFILNLSW